MIVDTLTLADIREIREYLQSDSTACPTTLRETWADLDHILRQLIALGLDTDEIVEAVKEGLFSIALRA